MKTNYILSDSFDPYLNLAVEELLVTTVPADTCILYLWQNQNTVVIGKNQNCWSECKVHELEAAGGHLARRLSGGGAVYHDLGNLNFTFIADKKSYDVDRQMAVILGAIKALGIPAEKSGRNDITVEGKKFSGNAFFTKAQSACHHGTLLISADMEDLGRYLTVSTDKLQSKGVKSVKARVMNLSEAMPALSVPMMRDQLLASFEEAYGSVPVPISRDEIDADQVKRLYAFYASDAWKYSRSLDCTWQTNGRFSWGGITLLFAAQNGIVKEAQAYSDAMDASFIEGLPLHLKGTLFSPKHIADRIKTYDGGQMISEENQAMLQDIGQMVREGEF